MRRTTKAVVVSLAIVGLVSPVDASTWPQYRPPCDPKKEKCLASAVKYKNCTELRKVHRNGVARDATAAGKTGATVDADTYKANAGLDRDKDGIACE
ncbi:MAG: excalibur calcium-binding domain-containing protein [Actinomycetota bacterium]